MRRQRASWDMVSVCLVMVVLALPVWATEETVQNDSLTGAKPVPSKPVLSLVRVPRRG